jgi:hypothetical protein
MRHGARQRALGFGRNGSPGAFDQIRLPGRQNSGYPWQRHQRAKGDAEAEKAIQQLMDPVDEYIPTPVRALDKPFLMPIEDIFSIKGREPWLRAALKRKGQGQRNH